MGVSATLTALDVPLRSLVAAASTEAMVCVATGPAMAEVRATTGLLVTAAADPAPPAGSKSNAATAATAADCSRSGLLDNDARRRVRGVRVGVPGLAIASLLHRKPCLVHPIDRPGGLLRDWLLSLI